MKKRILSTLAAGAAAVLMLSGFESAMTVEELTEKSKSALSQVTSMAADMQGNASANLRMTQEGENGMSMDIPVHGKCDISFRFNMEPFQMAAEIRYNAEAMGQGFNGGTRIYILEKEDGTADGYMGTMNDTGVTEWNVDVADAQAVSTMKEMIRSTLSGDFSALSGMSMDGTSVDTDAMAAMVEKYQAAVADYIQISPQPVNVSGKDCYQITADIPGEVLSQLVFDAMSASGQTPDNTSLQMMQAVLGGFRMKIDSKIDAQTYLPVEGTFDLGESDFSQIGALVAASMAGTAEGMTTDVDVSELGMKCSFTCDEPVTVEVPAEALQAAAAQGGSSGTDIGTNPEDMIGSLLGGDDSLGTDTDMNPEDMIGSLLGGDDIDDGSSSLSSLDEGPIQNPDGSFRIQYEDYQGNVKQADVFTPDGMRLNYGSENYLGFLNDDYTLDVNYLVSYHETPEEAVEDELDTSYFESSSDYSDVTRTEISHTILADGTVVYYGTILYTYNGYRLGGTQCALNAGDAVVRFEIEKDTGAFDKTEASEAEVQAFASYIKPVA